jgi:hypothetical protein
MAAVCGRLTEPEATGVAFWAMAPGVAGGTEVATASPVLDGVEVATASPVLDGVGELGVLVTAGSWLGGLGV